MDGWIAGTPEAANENAACHRLSEGAHLKVTGGRILLVRSGGAPAEPGAVALAVIDAAGRHMVQLSAAEARFLAEQLTAPCLHTPQFQRG